MLGILVLAFGSGCASDGSRSVPRQPGSGDRTIVAILNGEPVYGTDLYESALENSGGAALRDLILDRELRRELTRTKNELSPADIERERMLFLEGLAGAAEAEGSQVAALVDSLRRSRGLGPVNFERSLRRSAALRKLVGGSVDVRDEDVAAAALVEFGPRARARVLVVRERELAGSLRADLLRAGAGERAMAFARAAVDHSLDASAGSGGLLARASPHDPGLAPPIREAVRTQPEGEVGPVLTLDRGYALVLVESRVPGREPGADELVALRERVRARLERVAMESLADRLLGEAKVIVHDRSLRWSWERESR